MVTGRSSFRATRWTTWRFGAEGESSSPRPLVTGWGPRHFSETTAAVLEFLRRQPVVDGLGQGEDRIVPASSEPR